MTKRLAEVLDELASGLAFRPAALRLRLMGSPIVHLGCGRISEAD